MVSCLLHALNHDFHTNVFSADLIEWKSKSHLSGSGCPHLWLKVPCFGGQGLQKSSLVSTIEPE